MIDESKCYELLGVAAGASQSELKAAHRDLAKVWHPDRFAHDPQLQAKALKKLKEINDAYDQLRSGKARRRPANPSAPRRSKPSYSGRHTQNSWGVTTRPRRWSLMLVAVVIFGVTFFFTSRSLIRRSHEQAEDSPSVPEQLSSADVNEGPEPNNRVVGDANESTRARNRVEQNARDEGASGSTLEPAATAVQPMATVTVTIDPTTGMLARRYCPVKSTMTYPKGNEPHQYCNVHMPPEPAPTIAEQPKESSIKSVAKRLASPSKWFEGKKNTGHKQDVKSP